MKNPKNASLLTALVLLASSWMLTAKTVADVSGTKPLPRAHAHNDYEHPRPLMDALDQGFCSVEADIFLVDGKLLVGHTRLSLRPDRTLQSLYLEPLRQRTKSGTIPVHPGIETLHLLIDIKTDATTTYEKLREVLASYSDILTTYSAGKTEVKAVTAVISGNRPTSILRDEKMRHAAIDGRPEDLEGDSPASLIPWISQSWSAIFQWRGQGPLSQADRETLSRLVKTTHDQGRKIRFWGLPDKQETWAMLWDAGVDWINTDKLKELRVYMLTR